MLPRFKQAPIVEDEVEAVTPALPRFKQAPIVEEAPVEQGTAAPLEGQPFFENYLGADYQRFKSVNGGQVYKNNKTGDLAYWSPNFETFDKKSVEKLLLGAPEDYVKKERERLMVGEELVRAQPVMSRLQQITKGAAFVGEWADEFKGILRGEEAGEAMRAQQAAFEEERPVEAGAYQALGGVLSTPFAVPGLAAKGVGAVQRMASGAVRQGLFGGAEGAVSGAGRAEEGERAAGAAQGAMAGAAIGAGTGIALEPLTAVVNNVGKLFGRTAAPKLAQELNVSEGTAKRLAAAFLRSDFSEARRILNEAGETAMLADAGVVTKNLLDNAIIEGSEVAAGVAQRAVTPRIKFLQKKLTKVMDTVLGKPKYMEDILEEIQAGARAPQRQLYDAAYVKRIPRGTPEGALIYGRIEDQIPQSYIDALNNSYRIRAQDPSNIRQLTRTKDPATGRVMLNDVLSVEDIDLITRRMEEDALKMHKDLNPLAFGVSAIKSKDGMDLENLAMSIRSNARKIVPEYDEALKKSRNTIQQRRAAQLGEALLDRNTRMADVAEALSNATPEEKAAMRAGLRSEVQDIILNTRVTINSPDFEVNSIRDLWNKFNNPATQEKVRAVLGPDEARKLYDVYREAQVAFMLQAGIAKNSATAGRLAQERIDQELAAPGVRDLMAMGQWGKAQERATQSLTGMRPEQLQMRKMDRWDEIATLLTQTQGADALRAVSIIESALAGQKVSDKNVSDVVAAMRKYFGTGAPTVAAENLGGEQVGQTFFYNPDLDDFE